tara:strand:- start:777 stop:1766 length:990 start_codon:yes stop_codon:yes gene_type:complete
MSWLSDASANRHKQSYIKGFLDISGGDVTVRHGNVNVVDGNVFAESISVLDPSANVDICGNVVVGGDLKVNQYQNTSVINTTITNQTIFVTDDLSLNGSIDMSGSIAPNSFYNANSMSMPYIAVTWNTTAIGSLNASYYDYRSMIAAAKIFTNIHADSFAINASTGGISNETADQDNYFAFRIFPGLWRFSFVFRPNHGSTANTQYIRPQFWVDDNNNGTASTTEYMVGFAVSNAGVDNSVHPYQTVFIPDGPSAWFRFHNYYTGTTRAININNTNFGDPFWELKCLHIGNWNGSNPTLGATGATDYSGSVDISFNAYSNNYDASSNIL